MKLMCTDCGGKYATYSCWNLTKQPHINNSTMIPAMPWDVNQVQGGPCYGWGGNRFNNQNYYFFNNQGYDPNGQSFRPNQNFYQEAGPVPESLQTGHQVHLLNHLEYTKSLYTSGDTQYA